MCITVAVSGSACVHPTGCCAATLPMTTLVLRVSKRSLDFKNQRRAFLLRSVHHESWESIAGKVVNLQNEHPAWGTVRNVVQGFDTTSGHRKYNYQRCGRRPWKMTRTVQGYILRRMKALRRTEVVTSASLQAAVAKHLHTVVHDASIRKFLSSQGYKWLPRAQKRKYTATERRSRVAFARKMLRLGKDRIWHHLSLSLDGVVLSMPPQSGVDRYNYCWGGETHMWRKRDEANLPSLAGEWEYQGQVPLERAIPLWGGISDCGFAPVLWHPRKKTNQDEWSEAVHNGKLTNAIRTLNPRIRSHPFLVLCDGEKFLHAKKSMQAYHHHNVALCKCPPKSPDLNPVEMFWAWLRKKLRHMDLADLKMKRCPLSKTAYTSRIKAVLRSAKAHEVASACARKLHGACLQVVRRRGAAADN